MLVVRVVRRDWQVELVIEGLSKILDEGHGEGHGPFNRGGRLSRCLSSFIFSSFSRKEEWRLLRTKAASTLL